METCKRVLNFMMVFVLLVVSLLSANVSAQGHTTDVVITKVGLDSLEGWPKVGDNNNVPYNGSAITNMNGYFGTHTVMKGVAFRVYKGSDTNAPEVTGGPFITDENGQVRISGLEDGTYHFVEDKLASTYVGPDGELITDAKAIPFTLTLPVYKADGTMFGTGSDSLYVYPKNTDNKPQIDKNFEGDGADYANYGVPKNMEDKTVGNIVNYEVLTKIPKGSAYKTLVWSDAMTEGLTYESGSLTIGQLGTNTSIYGSSDYSLSETPSGFVLEFTPAGLAKLATDTVNADVEFTLNYRAMVNEKAVIQVPEKNNITLQYGNHPKVGNTPINVKPSNGQILLEKTWSEGAAPAGVEAVFDVYNENSQSITPIKTVTLNDTVGWTATITGLDNDTEYRIVERYIAGYAPEYTSIGNGALNVSNKKGNNPSPLIPTSPLVVTGGKPFIKVDTAKAGLSGAEFIVSIKTTGAAAKSLSLGPQRAGEEPMQYIAAQNAEGQAALLTAYEAAEAAYQAKVKEATTDNPLTNEIAELKTARDNAYAAMKFQWLWTATTVKSEAFVFVAGPDGKFDIKGFAYGDYQLHEIKAPEGFALITTPIDFTINATSYAPATPQEIVNNKVTIPQTGGIGSVIFVLVGIGIMVVTQILRKRTSMADN